MANWDDFIREVKAAEAAIGGSGPCWYRGHARGSYRLVPSLFRHTRGLDSEQYLYEEFKKGVSGMKDEQTGSALDTLFRMQHYSVPTRLLDWTRTLGVAVYFAVCETIDPADLPAVWVLNPHALNQITSRSMPQPRRADSGFDYEGYFVLGSKDPSERPLTVDSMSVNPRMHSQNGAFTIHMKAVESLETQCPSVSGRMDSLKRVAVYSSNEQLRLRCSRLLYRFVEVDQQVARSWYGAFDPQAG